MGMGARAFDVYHCAVDSTIIYGQREMYLLSMRFEKNQSDLVAFTLDGALELSDMRPVSQRNDLNVRPAGRAFLLGGKTVRPSQDCTDCYGCALNFNEITVLNDKCFEEHLLKKISPASMKSDLSYKPQGLHTYNLSEREVVDLKGYESDLLFPIMCAPYGQYIAGSKSWLEENDGISFFSS